MITKTQRCRQSTTGKKLSYQKIVNHMLEQFFNGTYAQRSAVISALVSQSRTVDSCFAAWRNLESEAAVEKIHNNRNSLWDL